MLLCVCKKNVLQFLFSCRLYAIRHFIQDIAHLMEPAPLDFHLPPDFIHGILKSKCSVTYRKLWSCRKSSELQATQNLKPGFFAFSNSLMNCYKLFLSVYRNSNYYKETELLIIKAGIAVNPVSPDIYVFFSVEPPVCPFAVFFLPYLLEPCYCCRRKAFRLSPKIAVSAS